MPKLWVVSELYYPEETSTGYFLTKIAEGLAPFFDVGALCSQPTYSSRGVRAPSLEFRNGVHVRRCRATTLDKDVLLFKLVNLITISFSIFFAALRRFGGRDCVIAVTNPPLLPFLVALACWLRGARFILLIHDVYPEILVATGMTAPGSLLMRVVNAANRLLYGSASHLIVLGRDMKRVVTAKLNGLPRPVTVIPNWGDPDEIYPQARATNPLLVKLGLAEKFVIQYSGNMGRSHGLEVLLGSAEKLRGRPDIHLLFIGFGAKRKWLENAVKRAALANVTVLPYCLREDLATSLNACDVAAVSFVPGMSGLSVPSRLYNVLAAGKPVIAVADRDSELAVVVEEENVGWVIEPGDRGKVAEKIAEIAREAQANPEKLAGMGARARSSALDKYSLESAIESYRSVVAELYGF